MKDIISEEFEDFPESFVQELLENDELTPEEEAFMRGYEEAA
jgi:hypothetical protein